MVTIEAIAVTIAMYGVLQFYVQMRVDLAPNKPFLKVVAIKLVIFLSFWQDFVISIITSKTINLVKPSKKLEYPDIAVGIPSLLLCIEMAIFSVLHLFAFPYSPYTPNRRAAKYPGSYDDPLNAGFNEIGPKQGGFLGIKALFDAMNPWDLVKAFARGMRWIFVGRKHREHDPSYKSSEMTLPTIADDTEYRGADGLPISDEFRRSSPTHAEEDAGLIEHAQPNPYMASSNSRTYVPANERYDPVTGQEYDLGPNHGRRMGRPEQDIGVATSGYNQPPEPPAHWTQPAQAQSPIGSSGSPQDTAHSMLWGSPPRHPQQSYQGTYNGQTMQHQQYRNPHQGQI